MSASSNSKGNAPYPAIGAVAGATHLKPNNQGTGKMSGAGNSSQGGNNAQSGQKSPAPQSAEQGYIDRALARRAETGIDAKAKSNSTQS